MRFILTFILTSLLFSCGSSDALSKRIINKDTQHHIEDSSDSSQVDSVLTTVWYFISDASTGYKRQLLKSGESYNIALMPIVTTANFDKVSMFHEKDCWALFTWLNKKGVQALNTAKQNAKSKMIAFILDNKLLRLQLVEDPQFARVEENADPRVYGEVLTFPCNSFSPEELKNFETILKSEQKGNR
jgi:hypothetical protein